jgi:hypothetical protein
VLWAPLYSVRGRETGGRHEAVRRPVGCTIIHHEWGGESFEHRLQREPMGQVRRFLKGRGWGGGP